MTLKEEQREALNSAHIALYQARMVISSVQSDTIADEYIDWKRLIRNVGRAEALLWTAIESLIGEQE